jgi:VanZ family protein
MTPGIRALLFALSCASVVGLAWYTGHKSALDPGGYKDDVRKGWTFVGDKLKHAVGCMLTVLIGFYVFGYGLTEWQRPDWLWVSVWIGWGAWLLVEAAQRYPRRRYTGVRYGRFSVEDVVADTVGAIAAFLIIVGVSG